MHNKKALYLFLLKALILYILWNILSSYILKSTSVEEKMTSTIASISSNLMNVWGFNTTKISSYTNNSFQYSEIWLDDQPLVLIANPCNGLTLIALFIGFIIAYPGIWKIKIVYCIIGSALIYLINLIRIQVLVFNIIYSQDSFDFNHKYTYTIAVYLCILILWMLWVNHYSFYKKFINPNKIVNEPNKKES